MSGLYTPGGERAANRAAAAIEARRKGTTNVIEVRVAAADPAKAARLANGMVAT